MNFLKENRIIILAMALIVIASGLLLGRLIFPEKEVEEDERLSVEITSGPRKKATDEVSSDNLPDESANEKDGIAKFYLNEDLGQVAEVYNKMLDKLEEQKLIVETTDGYGFKKLSIDLERCCMMGEYDDYYECWYFGDNEIRQYKCPYDNSAGGTGYVQSIGEYTTKADFINVGMHFDIRETEYIWEYELNENVEINGRLCYEIIATGEGRNMSIGPFVAESNRGFDKVYIDMETYELVEKESNVYRPDTDDYESSIIFYEYTDGDLEMPKSAVSFLLTEYDEDGNLIVK